MYEAQLSWMRQKGDNCPVMHRLQRSWIYSVLVALFEHGFIAPRHLRNGGNSGFACMFFVNAEGVSRAVEYFKAWSCQMRTLCWRQGFTQTSTSTPCKCCVTHIY